MTNIFPSALEARTQTLETTTIVITEILTIQLAIIAAVQSNLLTVTITNTTMTTATTGVGVVAVTTATMSMGPAPAPSTQVTAERYFEVWQNLAVPTDPDVRPKQLQMSTIVKYFTDAGYSIAQQVNPASNNTFMWVVNY